MQKIKYCEKKLKYWFKKERIQASKAIKKLQDSDKKSFIGRSHLPVGKIIFYKYCLQALKNPCFFEDLEKEKQNLRPFHVKIAEKAQKKLDSL